LEAPSQPGAKAQHRAAFSKASQMLVMILSCNFGFLKIRVGRDLKGQQVAKFLTDPNTYHEINDVPPQLQANIAFGHSTGVPIEALAIVYDMPLDWIRLFVGSSVAMKN
jgi:hypothetical protein